MSISFAFRPARSVPEEPGSMSSSLVEVTTGDVSVRPRKLAMRLARRGRRSHTVALADTPAGPNLVQVGDCFFTEWCSTTEYETDSAKIVFCAFSLVAQHLDEDGRNESHLLNLEALDG
jgi:hypothetical protein